MSAYVLGSRLGLRVVVRGVGHWIGGIKNWCAADGNVTHQWKVAIGVGKFLSASLSVSDLLDNFTIDDEFLFTSVLFSFHKHASLFY